MWCPGSQPAVQCPHPCSVPAVGAPAPAVHTPGRRSRTAAGRRTEPGTCTSANGVLVPAEPTATCCSATRPCMRRHRTPLPVRLRALIATRPAPCPSSPRCAPPHRPEAHKVEQAKGQDEGGGDRHGAHHHKVHQHLRMPEQQAWSGLLVRWADQQWQQGWCICKWPVHFLLPAAAPQASPPSPARPKATPRTGMPMSRP